MVKAGVYVLEIQLVAWYFLITHRGSSVYVRRLYRFYLVQS